MRLAPRDHPRLLLAHAGALAQRRLARGCKLNLTEATALISSVLHELIRDSGSQSTHSVAELMQVGKEILGRRHVLPEVPSLLYTVQVEGTFPDGVFLVTVHSPICTEDGDLSRALYGSFLPIPDQSLFPSLPVEAYSAFRQPGAVIPSPSSSTIKINEGRERIRVKVTNNGDRPIQVGSHFPFLETNSFLSFDRLKSYGKRLDIPSGTAVRFEPGETKSVTLCSFVGAKILTGGNLLAPGPFDGSPENLEKIRGVITSRGFAHQDEAGAVDVSEATTMPREEYIAMYGPTTGDRVRLGDTSLWAQVEYDLTASGPGDGYGDEVVFGGGKTIREGQGQATNRSSSEAMDVVITNALIIDWSGIYKADIGVQNGLIAGIGKAGNPDVMNLNPSSASSDEFPSIGKGVGVPLIIGSSTEIISGENYIITAGAIDCHVHYICPQLSEEALAAGITTLIGGGTGPASGTCATTCTSSAFYLKEMMLATDGMACNFGWTGKGNDAGPLATEVDGENKIATAMDEIIFAGALGLKLHEDWGSSPAAITAALDAGDRWDVQVNVHTDTLNEAGFVERTIEAFGGRTIHTYHTEGAGGGHAPDIIVVCEQDNVLPSSTNPTRPFAKNTLDEHLDMLMVCHHLSPNIPSDLAFAESRIRGETVAAEDVLHDIGAISMISSDSQAMGRIGEVIARTWRTAHKMKEVRGPLTDLGDVVSEKEELGANDNGRIKRYVAKYTVNPALTHGISHAAGQIKIGTLADLVLWKPSNFGSKPEMVLKSGVIAWAQMGDANASIPSVQPFYGKPMWGAQPGSAASNSVNFVSQVSIDKGFVTGYGLKKRAIGVKNCRSIKKKDMKWNDQTPKMKVDPETYEVWADGVLMDVKAAETVALGRSYNLF